MKVKILALVALALITAVVASCSSTPAATPTRTSALTDTYTDALSVRNQLLFGIIQLGETPEAVTAEQAKQLLVMAQTLKTLTTSQTAADEETAAVQAQMESTLTKAQVDAIASMKLTNASLTTWYSEQGISVPTPQPGVTPGAGRNSNLTTEQKEATRAAMGGTGTSGSGSSRGTILVDKVLEYLSKVVG